MEKFDFANAERNCRARFCLFNNKISLLTLELPGLSLSCHMEMDWIKNYFKTLGRVRNQTKDTASGLQSYLFSFISPRLNSML